MHLCWTYLHFIIQFLRALMESPLPEPYVSNPIQLKWSSQRYISGSGTTSTYTSIQTHCIDHIYYVQTRCVTSVFKYYSIWRSFDSDERLTWSECLNGRTNLHRYKHCPPYQYQLVSLGLWHLYPFFLMYYSSHNISLTVDSHPIQNTWNYNLCQTILLCPKCNLLPLGRFSAHRFNPVGIFFFTYSSIL